VSKQEHQLVERLWGQVIELPPPLPLGLVRAWWARLWELVAR